MRLRGSIGLAFAACLAASTGLRDASAAQMQLHQCVTTRIAKLTSRLEGMPESGSGVVYANGISGVSYEIIPGLKRSRAGDPVRLCLVSLPQDCPKGDDRGKIYRAQNLRTGGHWELPDSEHMCGGA